jgi:hypothetical protein
MRREISTFRRVVGALAAAVLGAAVVRELALPRDQRTWHGSIAGVPYDLRRPTLARLRASWWAPEDPRLVTPRAFGVGWALNLGRIAAWVRQQSRRHA